MDYISKVEGGIRKTQNAQPMQFTSETDRVYLGTQSTVVLKDPSWNRTLRISKSGSNGSVVWNPWIDKAKALPDFGDNEWPSMICIETVNALENSVQLAAGAQHEMTQKIEVVAGA